jgi:hypothetical protein
MSDQKKTTEHTHAHTHAHKPVDSTMPGAMFLNMFRTEALKMADESEKAAERTMSEVKRATVDSSRLWESQLELHGAMSRAMFDSVRRAWNI